jgi:hypothetical protein
MGGLAWGAERLAGASPVFQPASGCPPSFGSERATVHINRYEDCIMKTPSVSAVLNTHDLVAVALRTPNMPLLDDQEIAGIIAAIIEDNRPLLSDEDYAQLCGIIAVLLKRSGVLVEVLQ